MINKQEFENFLKNKNYAALRDFKVDNAIIMAAGLSSRFQPLSTIKPKGLAKIKGEVLVERQIKQLQDAGIDDIYLIVGYKKEMFYYLKDKYHIHIIENDSYNTRNNTGSLILVKDILKNSYICSVDNYFTENVFEQYNYQSYYSSIHINGKTDEWCLKTDEHKIINDVVIGGEDADIMLGHVYFNQDFSKKFVDILMRRFDEEAVKNNVWEALYMQHLDELKLELKSYNDGVILEFDSIEEAKQYDPDFEKNNPY